jgi:hypothetical protein
MSTCLKQKPIKNRWQPLPHQTNRVPPHRDLGSRNSKKEPLPGVKNNMPIATSVCLEQGNLLSQRAPFFLVCNTAPIALTTSAKLTIQEPIFLCPIQNLKAVTMGMVTVRALFFFFFATRI